MFEIGPLGCIPLVVSEVKPDDKCVEVVNSMVTMFNGKLYFKLIDLTNSIKGLTFYLAQTYRLLYDMVENPARFGKAFFSKQNLSMHAIDFAHTNSMKLRIL